MKKIIILLSVLLLSCGWSHAQNRKLTTLSDSVSYAIGIDVGGMFKSMPYTFAEKIDIPVFVEAITDVFNDRASLSREEAAEILRDLFYRLEREASEEARRNNDDFLSKNLKRRKVHTTESGLQYEVVKKGKGTARPGPRDEVSIHYRGTLIDGTEFDNSRQRGEEPASFRVDHVIPGFTEALQLMSPGDTYLFYIPSDLGYGSRENGTIPANSVLIFEIELLDFAPDED